VSFTLNGKPTRLTVDEGRPLLWVLLENEAVRACTASVGEVAGKKVTTIEGLGLGNRLHPVQQAFVDHAAFQCGYCTSGMILGAYAFLLKNPRATRADIIKGMDSHFCRCGAHVRIVQAIETAAAAMKGGTR
jgi:aerobic-type carbon monoxide dehydrogenase small subunit (CoxS/CutS family)